MFFIVILTSFFLVFTLWFVPWVFVLKLGFLFYFPYSSDQETRYLKVTGPITHLWSDSTWIGEDKLPETCMHAVVASEDTKFYEHNGVDIESTMARFEKNIKKNKITGGASTITQQLVKNAFLSRKKSYLRKAREISGALLLDQIMGKRQQLVWYLNIVEFGKEIYGIQEASRYYFKKDASKLTPQQCIALVVILPAPKRWNKSLETKKITRFFSKRYYTILGRMRILGHDKARNLAKANEIRFW